MSYFADSRSRRRPWGYLVSALAGVLLGVFLVVYLLPGLLAQRLLPYLPQPPAEGPALPPAIVHQPTDSPVVHAADRVLPSVVGIINAVQVRDRLWGRVYEERWTGSGVIIRPDGYILTNEHVVSGLLGESRLTVVLEDGREVPATLVGSDLRTDLAVIKVDEGGLPAAELGDSDRLRVGELAVAIGNPAGLDFPRSVTAGVISGLDRVIRHQEAVFRLIQTDAAINQGNSGGPLVNAAGQVIGINTLKFAADGFEGMGFAIPINQAGAIAEELMAHGRVIRPWLGITLAEAEEALRRYNVRLERGVLLVHVWSGSPAGKAGLRAGDILLTLDGRPINDYVALRLVLDQKRVGDVVQVGYRREGADHALTLTLAEMPETPD
ncbi:MAG: trypsin-like peptidase domain-containing protein [bacterium]|nr:trypsin-like peptidase domain-containing protein [bacterium]